MKLYWAPRTRSSRIVWMLEEAGADYALARVDLADKSKNDPAFRAASPLGKVPALQDGEAAFADSTAIALYIADRFPDAKLAPPVGDPARGKYYYWMVFTGATMEPAMTERFEGHAPNPQRHGWGDFDSAMASVDAALKTGPWILGERFSAADVLIGSALGFAKFMNLLPESPVMADYVKRCFDRPAYKRAQEKEAA